MEQILMLQLILNNFLVSRTKFVHLMKYILKREINMVDGVAVGYANMMAMRVLNVSPFADFSSAVNLSQLNNHNTFISHVNLNRHIIDNLLQGIIIN